MLDRSRLACELATRAGALIRDAAGRRRDVEFKSAVDLVTDVDRASQSLLVDGIRDRFPDDRIVAEEDGEGLAPDPGPGWCWCIDPLDGTTNFVHSLPHYAVSVAVLENGIPQAAAVYNPCSEELYRAERGGGAWAGNQRMQVSETADLDRSLLVTGFPYDRREQTDRYLRYFRAFLRRSRDLRRYGSASLDLCYVAAGRFDGFWECGLAPWDTAAGWLVVEEAGGRVSDFDGSPYDPWRPRVLASNSRIHEAMAGVLADPAEAALGGVPGGH